MNETGPTCPLCHGAGTVPPLPGLSPADVGALLAEHQGAVRRAVKRSRSGVVVSDEAITGYITEGMIVLMPIAQRFAHWIIESEGRKARP